MQEEVLQVSAGVAEEAGRRAAPAQGQGNWLGALQVLALVQGRAEVAVEVVARRRMTMTTTTTTMTMTTTTIATAAQGPQVQVRILPVRPASADREGVGQTPIQLQRVPVAARRAQRPSRG